MPCQKKTVDVNLREMLSTKNTRATASSNHRFFIGWVMVGIAAVAQYLSAPGQSYSVATFKEPMRMNLGISDTDFSAAYLFATICSACLLPIVGRLVDRFGARIMLPIIAFGLGSACMFMSGTDSLSQLYFRLSLVRSMGQGCLMLVSTWLVGSWFERRRGMATAIVGLGCGFSMMTFPLINDGLIGTFGWERTWTLLGFTVWVILILPGLIIIRNRPEDVGLHPDGIEPEKIPRKDNEVEPPHGPMITSLADSWRVGEVLCDLTFWRLLIVPATVSLVGTGLTFHQVALLDSHEITRTAALRLMSLQAVSIMLMTLPAGWLTDRLESRYLFIVSMVVLGLAIMVLIVMPASWWAIPYALLLGIAVAILHNTGSVVWINYYGRVHQGAVRGVATSVIILASALGPLPLAVSIETFDSYQPALYLFLVLSLGAAAAVWSARPPRRSAEAVA